jgi:hypothetical protein
MDEDSHNAAFSQERIRFPNGSQRTKIQKGKLK